MDSTPPLGTKHDPAHQPISTKPCSVTPTERYRSGFGGPHGLGRGMTVTLITGANKGIGYETARQLLKLGHTVYIGARDTERGAKAAAELGARFVQLDVT